MSQTSHNDTAEDDKEQGFISHLLELRDRLLRMVLALLVVFIGLFPFANDIYTYLAKPLLKSLPSGEGMIAVGIIDPFLIPLKLAFAAALFIVISCSRCGALLRPACIGMKENLRCRLSAAA